MQKDFITATPDSGGSGSTTVTVTAPANQTESARSTSLSVAGGGMTRTVGASQAAGVVTWNYYFSVTPTSLSFVAGGESKTVTVTSYRKKVINGVETSTQENVNYTVSVTGTGFSGSGTTVTAAANSVATTRSGTATYTQTGSGKTQAVSLSQAAGAQWYLNIEVRDVITGSPGNWDIEIQYRVTGGNIRNFPNQDDFDVILSFSYETQNGTISVHDALIESTSPNNWMDLIGQGWQPSYYGSVSSNSDDSPYVSFNGLYSTATPSIAIQ